MCGIFGYVGYRSDSAKIVLDGLKSLEYRGYDSWGIASLQRDEKSSGKDKIFVTKKTGHIDEVKSPILPPSHLAFGHTRWATHGRVTVENAHPHVDCNGKIALIHNGIIENYRELRQLVLSRGHKLKSDTDSEIAIHLIEEYSKNMVISKAVQKAFNQIAGLNAFIVLSVKENILVAVRNGSPIVAGFGTRENFLASDAAALLPYTKQVHYLEDNEMAVVEPQKILIFNTKTGDLVEPIKYKLDWTVEQTVKGKYPYFLVKEIYEQPAILADIAANYENQADILGREIHDADKTYLIGSGSAAYAGMAGSYIFADTAHIHANWAISSEFLWEENLLNRKSLIVALSQSGETMDTIEAIRIAKGKGARTFSLVNVLGSSLYRMADNKLLIGAGPEKSVASTKAFTAKIAHIYLSAYSAAGKHQTGKSLVAETSKLTAKILHDYYPANIRNLAQILFRRKQLYIIGKGLSYTASLETALKIKEISYIHAEGLAAGELKHGPLALIEKDTPCIVFLPDDKTYNSTLNAAMELKARGGYIVGISSKPNEIFDFHLPMPYAKLSSFIPNIVVGQLLAYEISILKGINPDKPRNLAKSVTVK